MKEGSATVLVRNAPKEHFGWLLERAHIVATSQFMAIEAVEEDTGQIVGMVGYDNWTKNAAEIHFAMDTKAALRALLKIAFEYPFQHVGILYGLTPDIPERAKILSWRERFGFREVARIKDGWDKGGDLVLSQLRKEDWQAMQSKER